MGFKRMIHVVLLQATLAMVLCERMVVNDLMARKESVKLDKETEIPKNHPIKTIHSEDGDIIDCIDIYKQPAFDHPALKDHKIQMNPSHEVKTETTSEESPVKVTSQTWRKSGSCPKGSIPVRRKQQNSVTKDYGRKKAKPFNNIGQLKDSNLLKQNHSVSVLHAEGWAYMGAYGIIKVWTPFVDLDEDYSTSKVALLIGNKTFYEQIESGWAVLPGVYGDRSTRFFTYWTVDGAENTGCFDLTCPGFVQTSNEIALGAAIYPISNPTGDPYEITIYIHKDMDTSNWWVRYGDYVDVGYWPADLFEMLYHHATSVQWGGEVYSPRVGVTPHTRTAMGNGRLPDFMFKNSGYIRRIRVLENSNVFRFPQWVNIYADEYNCYRTYYLSDYVDDPEFYFGGPGRSEICP